MIASFQGKSYQFPDGTPKEEVYRQLNSMVAQREAQSQPDMGIPENPEPGFFESAPDASFGNALKEQVKSVYDSVLAGSVSEKNTRYANRIAQQQAQKAAAETAKLSTVGQFGVGMAKYAPAVAAGIVNPIAGAGVAGAITAGDIASEQSAQGQDVDLGSAALGGTAAAAADLVTGGLAGKAVSKFLPESAGLIRRAVTKGTIDTAEDTTSAVAQQAMANIASGQDWDEGLGDAAMMGAAGGRVVRGAMGGLNRALKLPTNEGGKVALEGMKNMSNKSGTIPDEFADNAFGASNVKQNFRNMMDNATTPEELDAAIADHANVATHGKGNLEASILRVNKFAEDQGLDLPIHSYDVNLPTSIRPDAPTINAGELLGKTKSEMAAAAEQMEGAKKKAFGDNELEATQEKKKFQDQWQQAMGAATGNLSDNFAAADSIAREVGLRGDIQPEMAQKARDLKNAVFNYNKALTEYAQKNTRKTGNQIIEHGAAIDKLTRELGVQDQFKSILGGESGKFDPISDAQDFHTFEAIARTRLPSVKEGSFEPSKVLPHAAFGNIVSTGGAAIAGGATAGVPGMMAGLAVHAGIKELKARSSQKAAANQLEVGRTLTRQLAEHQRNLEMQSSLRAGDTKGASETAAQALDETNIKAPEGMDQPIQSTEPDISTPTEEPIVREEPEPVEAPQPAPEPIQESTAPLGVRRPAERTEAPVEPVAPAPAPEPLPVPKRKPVEAVEEPAPIEETVPVEPIVEPEPVKAEPLPVPKKKAPEPEPEAPKGPSEEEVAAEKEAKKATVMSMSKKLDEKIAKAKETPIAKRDPYLVSKLMKERDDLHRITSSLEKDTKAGESVTADDVAAWIDEKGGIEALRDEAGKAGRLKGFDAFVRQQFTNDLNANIAEAKKVITEAKTTASDALKSAKAEIDKTKIEGKHQRIRDELDMTGYPKEVIDEALQRGGASDTAKDFNPADVRRFAKLRYSQSKEKAQADLKAAQEKVAKIAKTAADTLESQRNEVKELMRGINIAQDPEVGVIMKKALGNRTKPLSDVEMKRLKDTLENHFAQQQEAYEKALKSSSGMTDVERNKYNAMLSTNKHAAAQIKEVKAKQEASRKTNLAEAQKAAQELQKKHDMYDEMFTKGERKIQDMEDSFKKLDKQQSELHQFMVDSKVHDDVAQTVLHKVFSGKNKPLTDEQIAKVKHNVLAQAEKLDRQAVLKVKETLDKAVGKMDRMSVEALADDLINNSDLKEASDVKQRGLIEAVGERLKEVGDTDKVEAMYTFFSIVQKADKRAAMFPDRKDMLVSGDDYIKLQKLMSKTEGSNYIGNLGKRLALHILGDRNAGGDNFRLSEEILRKAEAEGVAPKTGAKLTKKLPFRKRIR